MEGKKQTAIDWLADRLESITLDLFEQAKQMEREQIIEACDFGRAYGYNQATGYPNPISNPNQYYDKTYGKDKSET